MDHVTPTSGFTDSVRRKWDRVGRSLTSDTPQDQDNACFRALPQKLSDKYGPHGWVVSKRMSYSTAIILSNKNVEGRIEITCFVDGHDKADTDIRAKCGADVVASSTGSGYKSLNAFDTDVYARINKYIPQIEQRHALQVKDPTTGKIKHSTLRKATDKMKTVATVAGGSTAVVASAATFFALPAVAAYGHAGAAKVAHATFRR